MSAAQPENSEDLAAAKRRLRAVTRARRRALSPDQRREIDAELQRNLLTFLAERLSPGAGVGAYCPMATEPGGADLPDILRAAGYEVYVPRILGDTDLEWVKFTGEIQSGPMGIREPVGAAIGNDLAQTCAMVVLPALGIDASGNRLGQGGGFYDRQVARGRLNVPKCALIDSEEFHNSIPHAPHDLSVDFTISQHGLRNFSHA